MSTKATPIQILRSEVLKKRPDPARLLSGQPAVNINATEPGFFFSDEFGTTLIKIGPCAVGPTAPNAGATGPAGALGNTKGELWFDNTNPLVPALKVYDGTNWMYASPPTLISDTAPLLGSYPDNSMWWDSATGLLYVLYNDGTTRQWTQVSSNTVQ
jgi:hypothetical protein